MGYFGYTPPLAGFVSNITLDNSKFSSPFTNRVLLDFYFTDHIRVNNFTLIPVVALSSITTEFGSILIKYEKSLKI